MNLKTTLALLSFVITISSCKIHYPLPDAKMTPNQICGQDGCTPGNVGRILNFTKNPYSPGIKENSSSKDIAYAVLGHTIASKDISGSDINTCSNTSANPFTIEDIEPIQFSDGRDIQYRRTEKLNLNVEASTEANLKELAKLNLDAVKIEELEVKIKAAYSRINGKDLTVEGKYSEWGLTYDAREKIKKGDGFTACRKYIEDNNQRIITAVGLVYFDILFEASSVDKLAAEIDAELKREGIQASLAFTFKREISKNLKATSKGVFQILVWRHAGLKGNSLVAE